MYKSDRVKYIKSIFNRYGETEHSFEVDGKVKTYCIPVGVRQSVDGLMRVLIEDLPKKPDPDVAAYVSEGLGEW